MTSLDGLTSAIHSFGLGRPLRPIRASRLTCQYSFIAPRLPFQEAIRAAALLVSSGPISQRVRLRNPRQWSCLALGSSASQASCVARSTSSWFLFRLARRGNDPRLSFARSPCIVCHRRQGVQRVTAIPQFRSEERGV